MLQVLRPRLYPVGAHHPCTARPPNPAGTRRREPAIYEAFKALAQHQKDVSSTVKVTAFDDVGSRQPLEPGTCDILAFPEGRPCCAVLARRGSVATCACSAAETPAVLVCAQH